ncbi:MAG: hypothetical protein HYV02_03490 [Deltaproteobacteria bacterium]|nr:hypothetical protein [Deltaproteobacteria bacterium]
MPKYFRIAIIFTSIAGIAACKGTCKKAGEETTVPPEQAATAETAEPSTTPELAPEQIADALSKAVCSRMVACNPESGVSETDCAAGMTKDLAQALPDKAKVVQKGVLEMCVAAIAAASCEDLNSPTPPKGCEFME